MATPQEIGIGARLFVFLVYLGLGLVVRGDHDCSRLRVLERRLVRFHHDRQSLVPLLPYPRRHRAHCLLHPLVRPRRLLLAPRNPGQTRFTIGILLLGALSYLIAADLLASPKRSAWEIAPAVLKEDKGEPAGCALGAGTCQRLPILQALKNLRHVSQTHLGLAEFIRDCDRDVLLEGAPGAEAKRFCFASTPLSPSPPLQSDADCCRAQERLSAAVTGRVAHRNALAHG